MFVVQTIKASFLHNGEWPALNLHIVYDFLAVWTFYMVFFFYFIESEKIEFIFSDSILFAATIFKAIV